MTVHPSAIVSAPPFSFYPDNGRAAPAEYGVAIDPDVEILPLSVVEAGTNRPTKIGAGTRIGPQVYVGHDTEIGSRVWVAAGAKVAGWVVVGDGAYLGMNCSIRQHIRIGAGAFVGMGAVVVKDVPENAVVVGNPARVLRARTWEGRQ